MMKCKDGSSSKAVRQCWPRCNEADETVCDRKDGNPTCTYIWPHTLSTVWLIGEVDELTTASPRSVIWPTRPTGRSCVPIYVISVCYVWLNRNSRQVCFIKSRTSTHQRGLVRVYIDLVRSHFVVVQVRASSFSCGTPTTKVVACAQFVNMSLLLAIN